MTEPEARCTWGWSLLKSIITERKLDGQCKRASVANVDGYNLCGKHIDAVRDEVVTEILNKPTYGRRR